MKIITESDMVVRGSTPTISIGLDSDTDLSDTTKIVVTMSQNHEKLIVKTNDDITFDSENSTLRVPLTQKETLLLDDRYPLIIQAKGIQNDGNVWNSKCAAISVYPDTNGEVINDN